MKRTIEKKMEILYCSWSNFSKCQKSSFLFLDKINRFIKGMLFAWNVSGWLGGINRYQNYPLLVLIFHSRVCFICSSNSTWWQDQFLMNIFLRVKCDGKYHIYVFIFHVDEIMLNQQLIKRFCVEIIRNNFLENEIFGCCFRLQF